MKKLSGKTAIVTGSDSGIGQATAIGFAREGANVVIIYHSDKAGGSTYAMDGGFMRLLGQGA